MKNFKALLIAALAVVGFGFAACSSDDDPEPAVGITAVSVAPASSPIDYACAINGNQIVSDPVKMSTTEAELQQTVVKVTPTYNCTVECGGQTGTQFTVDATQPVTIKVSGFGKSVTYTLTVTVATEPSTDDMELLSSSFIGFTGNVISYDMAYFKDAFYATVTSVDGTGDDAVEHYDIYKSTNGINWEKVNYTVSNVTEGTARYIGGEMARMVVFKDKLYIMGGMRTKGKFEDGTASEGGTDWSGNPAPALNVFRCYSTSDGVSYTDETQGMTVKNPDGTDVAYATAIVNTGMHFAENNGTLYMKNGYSVGFGMLQPNSYSFSTTDGKNWTMLERATSEDETFNFNNVLSTFYTYKGKIYRAGGSSNNMSSAACNTIYETENFVNWAKTCDLPAEMQNILGWTAVAGDNCVLIFGGQTVAADAFNNKVFRSTDCITWETVEGVPASYTGTRCPAGVKKDNVAWIFGGYNNYAIGFFGQPDATSTLGTETWVKRID